WHEMINDFSIYTFPDAKNPQQFFKAGAALQNLSGDFDTGLVKKKYYNFFVHGEYRNRTRNKKWDIEASGNFYINGLNAGDYNAFLSLKRFLSSKLGYLSVGFQNVNRTPSFVFNEQSSFDLDPQTESFNKENSINIFGSLEQPLRKLRITGSYYLISNYTYFNNFYDAAQVSSIFNVLQIIAEKQIRIRGKWNWRTIIVLQQKAGNSPVNMPLLLTRNQVGYDGNLGFKNLSISMGLEFRYFTPFYIDRYSPLNGQFFNNTTEKTRLKVPEIHAYVHFRIKSFTAYLRGENLNTLDITNGGFTRNNVIVPGYPYPGMQIRLGIFWSFVN
ncbi:MAG TPA: putative porin, partial [Flavitalea sp.]|nr:putative porin [Flavitalea sp.]